MGSFHFLGINSASNKRRTWWQPCPESCLVNIKQKNIKKKNWTRSKKTKRERMVSSIAIIFRLMRRTFKSPPNPQGWLMEGIWDFRDLKVSQEQPFVDSNVIIPFSVFRLSSSLRKTIPTFSDDMFFLCFFS